MFEVLAGIKFVMAWVGWLGVGLVPVLIAGAVIWFLPPLRKLAAILGAAWILIFAAYTYGDHNGAERVHDEWKAAEERGINESNDAREAAERTVEPAAAETPVVEEPVLPPAPGSVAPVPRRRAPAPEWLRNDKHNRDNR